MNYIKMKNNKTICFFNSANAWGGGEKWHLDISHLLLQNGFRARFAISKKSDWKRRIESKQVPYDTFSISNFSFLNPFKIFRIASYLKKEQVKTIIINLSKDLKAAGLAAKLAGVEHIIYRRGSAIPIKNSVSNRFIFKHIVSTILANSEKTKQTVNQNNPNLFAKDKIHVVYNGLDFDAFNNQPVNQVKVFDKDEIIIGNIGRIVEQKAQDKLLELAVKLKKENIKFKILIGGKGKLLETLKLKAKALDIEEQIIFTGFVKDAKSFLESINIFILSSKWEGFGYVIVEAMACKKPVIAFDISSNPEIIDDNKTGFLIPPYDIDKLAEKVIAIAHNKSLESELGENGYQRALDLFSIDKTLADLLNLEFIKDCKVQSV